MYNIINNGKSRFVSCNHAHYIRLALDKENVISRLKKGIATRDFDSFEEIPIANYGNFEFRLAIRETENGLEVGGYVTLEVTYQEFGKHWVLFERNLDVMSSDFAGDIAREIEKVVSFISDEGAIIPYVRHRDSPCLDD